MLTLLKFIRSLFKGLNSDAAPWSCGLAVLLGCVIGLLPLGFHTVLFAGLLLMFRVPVAIGGATAIAAKVVHLALLQWIPLPIRRPLPPAAQGRRGLLLVL